MHSHMHGGGRRSPREVPWVLIATVAGIVVVVIAALFFFSGLGGSVAGDGSIPGPGTTAAPSVTSTAAASTPSASKTSTVVIATTTPVTVPATGVYIKVDYLGGFSGSYTANGVTTKKTNSGTRLYEIADATGTVTATFKKSDGTTNHALSVTIYKNGAQLDTGSTSAAYGTVTVTANV